MTTFVVVCAKDNLPRPAEVVVFATKRVATGVDGAMSVEQVLRPSNGVSASKSLRAQVFENGCERIRADFNWVMRHVKPCRATEGFYDTALNEASESELQEILPKPRPVAKEPRCARRASA